jgi:hypothetical protein
MPSVLAIP